MAHNIQVKCLVDRYWDPPTMEWDGEVICGTLIDISTQTADDLSGKLIPVGIVLLADGTFQSIPLEFIEKIEDKAVSPSENQT